MLFSARIRLKALVQLCQRLATATRAGIDDRRTWRSESQRGGRTQQRYVAEVADGLARGESVTDALAKTGGYFPPMFRQIVALGDASGQLDKAYRRLAEHYEHLLAARRGLAAALAWPLIQLGIAVAAIGAVIWISGALNLRSIDGQPLDLFGLGLTGRSGLLVYIILVQSAALAACLMAAAVQRGALWTRTLQRAAMKTPALGSALETLALSRFTWALRLILDTSMDLRRALPLALEATGNITYAELGTPVARAIQQGLTIREALAVTGKFPAELLDAIEVGEQSGLLAETMERQSKEYQNRAHAAMSVIGQFIGYLVWGLVAALIIVLIFRVFGTYMAPIQQMSQPGWKP